MNESTKPKSRKVTVTYDEYLAIQLGLAEIETTIGSGDITKEEELIRYQTSSKSLIKLLNKIIKV